MTNNANAPSVLAEGTVLPPPRAFGESNTLTLPRTRRGKAPGDAATRLVDAVAAVAASHTRVAVVPADPTPITLTL